jgi:hypothetical protein
MSSPYSFLGTTIRIQNISPADETRAATANRHVPRFNVNFTDIGGQEADSLSLTLFFASYSDFLSFKSNVGSYGSLVYQDGTVNALLTRLALKERNVGANGEMSAQADFTIVTPGIQANPPTVAANTSSQTVILYGYSTNWVSGTTTFSMSGGTGATLSSYAINNQGQFVNAVINTGTAPGTLTFSDSTDALTVAVPVT